jgi:hypothetical protein
VSFATKPSRQHAAMGFLPRKLQHPGTCIDAIESPDGPFRPRAVRRMRSQSHRRADIFRSSFPKPFNLIALSGASRRETQRCVSGGMWLIENAHATWADYLRR